MQLLKHLEKFDYLSQFQLSRRQFHSVETSLRKLCSFLVLLIFSAVFDTCDHDKLENFDVTGLALNWFDSFYTTRKFKVNATDAE